MWPLAQKQATHAPWLIWTTSALRMKEVSVMLCLEMHAWEGSDRTWACFSEHTTAYWLSLRSWDMEGDTETGLRLWTFSLSSPCAVALVSYQGS